MHVRIFEGCHAPVYSVSQGRWSMEGRRLGEVPPSPVLFGDINFHGKVTENEARTIIFNGKGSYALANL